MIAEQVTPGIDVVFNDDLPPGVLAYSEPQTSKDLGYREPRTAPALRRSSVRACSLPPTSPPAAKLRAIRN